MAHSGPASCCADASFPVVVLVALCFVVVVCRYMTDGVMLRESMRVR